MPKTGEINFEKSVAEIKNSMEKTYLLVYQKVNETLKNCYQDGLTQLSSIDIKKVAESLEIKVVEKILGSTKDTFSNEVMGYLDGFNYSGKGIQWSIYVNEDLGDLTKRYVIAHELAHFLLNDNKDGYSYTQYCIGSMLPSNSEEHLCDIAASFLLMPIEIVLDLMKSYIDENKNKKIEGNKWLMFLGRRLGISDYYTIVFYQNIKYLASILYKYQNNEDKMINGYDKGEFDDILKKIEECASLFR